MTTTASIPPPPTTAGYIAERAAEVALWAQGHVLLRWREERYWPQRGEEIVSAVRRVVGLAMREADERARLEERQAVAAQLQTWSAVMIGNGNLDGGNALRRAAAVLLSGDA